jgi:ATP-binding cassette subfamily B protein
LRDQVFALDHMFMSLFSTLGWLFRLAITAILLASIHPVLVLLMLFALPAFWVSTWRPAVERRTEESVIANARLARHLFVLGTTAPPAKEVRVTNTGDWLISERRAAWQRWYGPVSRVRWATAAWHTVAWAIFAGAYVAAVVYVATGLDRGVGDVVLVLAAGTRLARYVGATAGELGFLRGFWLDSSRRLTWLEDYAAGIDATATAGAPDRLTDGITFDHVSFSYPGTDRLVLDDVTLRLPAGAVVAVVGENGAGKTTMVKLLAKMYAPTAGRITIDDVDLADIATDEWRARLGGAFQDFYRFELHAQQTIGVGDLPRVEDRSATQSAVDRAGAAEVIDRLAYGLETQLGPSWDEGAEVSFGQWQKLALARGFMRDGPLLLILDEPTAALDAETEHALFERFAQASRAVDGAGRVTVLVSHRFSTVRMADLIVVMDGSRLVEFGSHEELMALGGQYSELFRIQAAAYS